MNAEESAATLAAVGSRIQDEADQIGQISGHVDALSSDLQVVRRRLGQVADDVDRSARRLTLIEQDLGSGAESVASALGHCDVASTAVDEALRVAATNPDLAPEVLAAVNAIAGALHSATGSLQGAADTMGGIRAGFETTTSGLRRVRVDVEQVDYAVGVAGNQLLNAAEDSRRAGSAAHNVSYDLASAATTVRSTGGNAVGW